MALSRIPARPSAAEEAPGSHISPHGDTPTVARDRGFGLALVLISALGTVVGIAVIVLVDWRAGLATYAAIILVLALFLRWEMRRRKVRHDQAMTSTASPTNLVGTETTPFDRS